MASFSDVLNANDGKLVNLFFRIKPSSSKDYLVRINHAASQVGLNHTQLVCALGFNKYIRELTDILALAGFANDKLLTIHRNELFTSDAYQELDIDNILDLYAELIDDTEMLTALQNCIPTRLSNLEKSLGSNNDPSVIISYKMEMHAIYNGGIMTLEMANQRLNADIGEYRLLGDEISLIVEQEFHPPSNLFFMNNILADEKRILIKNGHISDSMIRNRISNASVSEAEREMLEDFI